MVRRDHALLFKLVDEFRRRLGHHVPTCSARPGFNQDLVMQTNAPAAPVARLDEWLKFHELVDDFLRLILRDGAPPVERAFLSCRLDYLRVRCGGDLCQRNKKHQRQKYGCHYFAMAEHSRKSHSGILSCARAIPFRYMALNARESFAA